MNIEGMEGEIGMPAGGWSIASDLLEAVDTEQLAQAVEIVETLMVLDHTCQAHVLVSKDTWQQLDHSTDPRELDDGR